MVTGMACPLLYSAQFKRADLCFIETAKGRLEMNRKKGRKRAITGIVTPFDWNDSYDVLRVLIKTPDREEYVVEPNKQGKQLLSLVDRTVRVRGAVRQRLNGDFTVSVDNYKVIQEEEENQYVAEKHDNPSEKAAFQKHPHPIVR
jgi:hypothetical protein